MAQTIVYIGKSQVRQITDADWASVGITEPTRRWEQANSFEQALGDTAAAWALAQSGEFVSEDGLTFPPVIAQFGNNDRKEDYIHGRQHTAALRGWNKGLAQVLGGGIFTSSNAVLIGDSISQLGSFSDIWVQVNRVLNGSISQPPYYKGIRGTFPWDTVVGTEAFKRGKNNQANAMAVGDECILNAVDCAHLAIDGEAGSPGCKMEIRIDGTLVQTVTADVRWQYFYDPGTRATRQLKVKCITAPGIATGVQVWPRFNSYIGGWIVPAEWSRSGTSTQDFVDNPDLIPQLTATNPDLVIVATGINDGAHADPAGYKTRMKAFIQSLMAAVPLASFVLWIPPETGGHTPWGPVATKAHEIVRELGISVVDSYDTHGYIGGTDPYDFSSDGVHLTNRGKSLVSQSFLKVLFGDTSLFPAGGINGPIVNVGRTYSGTGSTGGSPEETAARQTLFMHRSIVGLEYAAVMDPTQATFRDFAVKSDPTNGAFAANRDYADKETISDKTATYVVNNGDMGKHIRMNAAGATNITINNDAALINVSIGSRIRFTRVGAGTVTFNGSATFNSKSSLVSIGPQFGSVLAYKVAANTWLLTGDLV